VPATMALDKERERGGEFLLDLMCLLRKGRSRSILSVSSYRMSNYES